MAFALAALLAFTGMWEEMTRLSFCRFYKTGKIGKSVVHLIFIDNLLLSCIIYFYLIPVGCLFPLVSMRLPENSDFLRLPLFMSLLCGINLVIFQSVNPPLQKSGIFLKFLLSAGSELNFPSSVPLEKMRQGTRKNFGKTSSPQNTDLFG